MTRDDSLGEEFGQILDGIPLMQRPKRRGDRQRTRTMQADGVTARAVLLDEDEAPLRGRAQRQRSRAPGKGQDCYQEASHERPPLRGDR